MVIVRRGAEELESGLYMYVLAFRDVYRVAVKDVYGG